MNYSNEKIEENNFDFNKKQWKYWVKTLKNVSPIVSPFFSIKAKTLVNQ
jgi:hypothetical protein